MALLAVYLHWVYTPEFGTNKFAGIGIGANGANRSDGAGTAPLEFAPFGFRTST